MTPVITLMLLCSAFTLAMASFFGAITENLPRRRWLYLFAAAMLIWAIGLVYFGATYENAIAPTRSSGRF